MDEYFTQTAHDREEIIYSLLRCSSLSRLNELYLSIQEGDIDFASAAIAWSEGPESARGGRVGPILASHAGHPELRRRLNSAVEGQFIRPFSIGDTHVLLRLDKRLHVRLDDSMQEKLLEELYQKWLTSQIESLQLNGIIEPIEYLPV